MLKKNIFLNKFLSMYDFAGFLLYENWILSTYFISEYTCNYEHEIKKWYTTTCLLSNSFPPFHV